MKVECENENEKASFYTQVMSVLLLNMLYDDIQ